LTAWPVAIDLLAREPDSYATAPMSALSWSIWVLHD
jgi:hypothetical protein